MRFLGIKGCLEVDGLPPGHDAWMLPALAACGSPIEEQFLDALVETCQARHQTARVLVRDRSFPVTEDYGSKNILLIITQEWLGGWPVDFVLVRARAKPDSDPVLVVECDGHSYHERTRYQAQRDRSRDRALQSTGYIVFRFTGTEINQDATACATACLDVLSHRWEAIA